jgi:hypothetical protein
VPLDDEVEAELEDGLLGGGGVGVREGVSSRGELVEEASRHGHVHPSPLRVEGTDPRAIGSGRRGGHGTHRHLGQKSVNASHGRGRSGSGRANFGRPKYTGSVTRRAVERGGRPDGRDEELPDGRVLDRPERRGDEGGVTRGLAEEPRQDLGRVLGRDDPRDLDDGGEAEIAAPEGGLDVGVLLDERGRRLAVLGGAGGEPELAAEELEQAGIPQLDPPALPVERREGDEKLREGLVLAAEEVGEAGGVFAGGRHAEILSRDSEVSWNARERLLMRFRAAPARALPYAAKARRAGAGAS